MLRDADIIDAEAINHCEGAARIHSLKTSIYYLCGLHILSSISASN